MLLRTNWLRHCGALVVVDRVVKFADCEELAYECLRCGWNGLREEFDEDPWMDRYLSASMHTPLGARFEAPGAVASGLLARRAGIRSALRR